MVSLFKEKRILLVILLLLTIGLSNSWIYQFYQKNLLFGFLLIIETILLFLSSFYKNGKIIPILIFIILTIMSAILLIDHFDKNIFSVSTIESIQIRERRQYYANELGKVYKNRIGIFYFDHLSLYFNKINNNFSSAFDLNLFFSTGLSNKDGRYPLFSAPLFIIGFLSLLINIKTIPAIYFLIALGVNSFVSLDSKSGLLLMLPFVNLYIAIGLIKCLELMKGIILDYKKIL
ncbi:hypothetical protein KKE78_05795 [Patescibacteria group bacterium]|nr:hypothetical protein [Patescibacteria group bacterium]